MDESLIYEVLSIVGEIPEGKVATYGQIAGLIGREKMPGWPGQAGLLAEEGMCLKANGHVDLRKFQWVP